MFEPQAQAGQGLWDFHGVPDRAGLLNMAVALMWRHERTLHRDLVREMVATWKEDPLAHQDAASIAASHGGRFARLARDLEPTIGGSRWAVWSQCTLIRAAQEF